MLRAHSIRGVRTHVSAPKSNTACTTALENIPKTFGSAPYRIKILVILTQFFLALLRLHTNAGQLSPPAVKTLNRYLKYITVSNGPL